MSYRTVAWLRYGPTDGEPYLSWYASVKWPDEFHEPNAFRMFCEVAEVEPLDWLRDNGYAEAVGLIAAMRGAELAARLNQSKGPFIFTTKRPLDERATLQVILRRAENERR